MQNAETDCGFEKQAMSGNWLNFPNTCLAGQSDDTASASKLGKCGEVMVTVMPAIRDWIMLL
jgi:hypothetical protein